MIDVDEVSNGWLVTEAAPFDADYVPRGGYVIDVVWDGSSETVFTTMDNRQGQLKKFVLRASEIDLVVRPSDQQPGPLRALIERVCKEVVAAGKGKRGPFTDYQRWLVGVAYRLSEHCP